MGLPNTVHNLRSLCCPADEYEYVDVSPVSPSQQCRLYDRRQHSTGHSLERLRPTYQRLRSNDEAAPNQLLETSQLSHIGTLSTTSMWPSPSRYSNATMPSGKTESRQTVCLSALIVIAMGTSPREAYLTLAATRDELIRQNHDSGATVIESSVSRLMSKASAW